MKFLSLKKTDHADMQRVISFDGLLEAGLKQAVGQVNRVVQGDAVPKFIRDVVVALGARGEPRGKQEEQKGVFHM